MSEPSGKDEAWAIFDHLINRATREGGYSNPWWQEDGEIAFRPDYKMLKDLLGVPLLLEATSQSGVPALALDVWTAYELRRAGFDEDRVWPRARAPRILPWTLVEFRRSVKKTQLPLLDELLKSAKTMNGETSGSANLLGKNYVKQVDVVMSAWNTGPEIMISTKRMDSSFGKNAADRVEESYGDAKNLRNRHPQAALGFVYGLRSTALSEAPATADWIVDLLGKLGREDDAYDAVALIIPEWVDVTEGAPVPDSDDDGENPLVAAGVIETEPDAAVPAEISSSELDTKLSLLPNVVLRHDAVPKHLSPDVFFATMVARVLDNCPITFHKEARARRAAPQEA